MTAEQRTSQAKRAALRRRYRREMTVWRALIGEYGDEDVLDAVADAEALAGALAEAARLQALVDACVEVLGHAMIRSDWNSLRLAGFQAWEMLTGATEAPKTGGAEE